MRKVYVSRFASIPLFLVAFPAFAIFMVNDFINWVDDLGYGIYWGWSYTAGGGSELVGGVIDSQGQVVEDATFDSSTGEMFDSQVYPQPMDFNDWHENTITQPSGGGGDGGSGGGGGGSCLLPDDGCLLLANNPKGGEMNTLSVIAFTTTLFVNAPGVLAQHADSVGGREQVVRTYLAELRRTSHLDYLRTLEDAVETGTTDTVLERDIRLALNRVMDGGEVDFLDGDSVEHVGVRCSRFACRITQPVDSDTEVFSVKREMHDIVADVTTIDGIGTNVQVPRSGAIDTYILRKAFIEIVRRRTPPDEQMRTP